MKLTEKINSHEEMRDYLIEQLKKEIYGPSEEEEILEENPDRSYIIGILYPQKTEIDQEEDKDSNDLPDEKSEIPILLSNTFLQSAIGLSFVIKGNPIKLEITVEAAKYNKFVTQEEDKEKKKKWDKYSWKRMPLINKVNVDLQLEDQLIKHSEIFPNEFLELRINLKHRKEQSFITVSLINRNIFAGSRYQLGEHCYYQPKLTVKLIDSENNEYAARKASSLPADINENQYELLHRNRKEFASGHGVAVNWDNDEKPSKIYTEFIPVSKVAAIDYSNEIFRKDPPNLSFKFLSENSRNEVIKELFNLTRKYDDWIEFQIKEIKTLPDNLKDTATFNMNQCKLTNERIKNGIKVLQENDLAFRCFQLMNEAMSIQLYRNVWKKIPLDSRPAQPVIDEEIQWRPFQIAFILLNLRGIVNPKIDERDFVDLLWFPTGGGKTEAYFGIIAFTIFLRRLRTDMKGDAGGVTAIMRYTLRLLTIQQTERASLLICACDSIRMKHKELGKERITLGLWVGGSVTPNTRDDALKAINDIKKDRFYVGPNPKQIHFCPWCGKEMSIHNFMLTNTKLITKCSNEKCEFSDNNGLPIYLIDDDIYDHRPTLLIGTVDKFARIPWKSDTGRIFGRDSENRIISRPPELIIQDELHLISGPLGTLVGLYETIIDKLCVSEDNTKPKIISSTATIRQAKFQVKTLFNRTLYQFPPSGIIASDSFFSREDPTKSGRYYLGLHAPGISWKTLLLRAYANLILSPLLPDTTNGIKDPYWTLVGYFNSIRELGGSRTLVDDDVKARFKIIRNKARKKIMIEKELDELPDGYKRYPEAKELTSRVPSQEIPQILNDLEISLESCDDPKEVIQIVLATNMLSVGVDINRLGLIVVNGQPKTTSEYIQATSRIGRKFPGLVITLYNWVRPRDKSHYEHFKQYHNTLYRYVEPTSVTPFSPRARDKGLHAVFISLVRHLIPGMAKNETGRKFANLDYNAQILPIISFIMKRISSTDIDVDEKEKTAIELEKIYSNWLEFSSSPIGKHLTYAKSYKDEKKDHPHLLHSAADIGIEECYANNRCYPTLNSLRNVEPEINLYIKDV